jgi:hypothetical protein
MLPDTISIVRSYLPILKYNKKLKNRIDEEEYRMEGMHDEFWMHLSEDQRGRESLVRKVDLNQYTGG